MVVEISIELCTQSQLAHASIDRFLHGTAWRVMIPSADNLIWFEHVSGCLLQDNTLRSPDVVALCTWCIALLESRDNTLMLRQEGSASLPNSAGVHDGNPTHSVSKSSKCDANCLFPQTPAMKWTRKPLESLHLTKSAVISRENWARRSDSFMQCVLLVFPACYWKDQVGYVLENQKWKLSSFDPNCSLLRRRIFRRW